MQRQTKPIAAKLSARLTCLKAESRKITYTPAINMVELLAETERHVLTVNRWQFDTREEAIDQYKRVCEQLGSYV